MDAEVANLLLDGNSPSLSSYVTANQAEYNSDETTADSDLQRAADDPGEQHVLSSVLNNMAAYEGLAARPSSPTRRRAARKAARRLPRSATSGRRRT